MKTFSLASFFLFVSEKASMLISKPRKYFSKDFNQIYFERARETFKTFKNEGGEKSFFFFLILSLDLVFCKSVFINSKLKLAGIICQIFISYVNRDLIELKLFGKAIRSNLRNLTL